MPEHRAPFLPHGRLPTLEDIERAALLSPHLHHCLALHRRGEMTLEQALMTATLALLDVNRNCHEALVEMHWKAPGLFIVPKPTSTAGSPSSESHGRSR